MTISVSAINAQLIDVSDVYNQMFRLARHCRSIMDKLDCALKTESLPQDEFVFDSSTPLLKELQLQIIQVSCQTIISGSTASQKATLTEAINGGDSSNSSSEESSNTNTKNQ